MTTPTLREALWTLVENNALYYGENHNTVIQGRAALAAQPELPEPVAEITSVDEYGPCLGWFKHWVNYPTGTKLYTAAQLQQAVEQAQAKREPMTENELAGALESAGVKTQYITDAVRRTHWLTMGSVNPMKIARAVESHHNIGDKA